MPAKPNKPSALDLVRTRWERETPHRRKTIEVAVLLRATSKEEAALVLEHLAERLRAEGRDGFLGYVGHGCGYHASSAYAGVDLTPSTEGQQAVV